MILASTPRDWHPAKTSTTVKILCTSRCTPTLPSPSHTRSMLGLANSQGTPFPPCTRFMLGLYAVMHLVNAKSIFSLVISPSQSPQLLLFISFHKPPPTLWKFWLCCWPMQSIETPSPPPLPRHMLRLWNAPFTNIKTKSCYAGTQHLRVTERRFQLTTLSALSPGCPSLKERSALFCALPGNYQLICPFTDVPWIVAGREVGGALTIAHKPMSYDTFMLMLRTYHTPIC